jgi:hypothetical protein
MKSGESSWLKNFMIPAFASLERHRQERCRLQQGGRLLRVGVNAIHTPLKNSAFLSGDRFSDTASFEIRRPFRGWAAKADSFRSVTEALLPISFPSPRRRNR